MSENNDDITVSVVEDDSEIRKILSLIIDRSPGFTCKQSYNDCESAITSITNKPTNVVLMDIHLPGMSGIEGVKILKKQLPDTDFIMLTIQEDDDSVFNSLCAGATGYLLKETSPVDILNSIKEVYQGGSPMSPSIARKIIKSFNPSTDNPLSKRENEILEKLCKGENYKSIADSLFISGHTVRAHIKNIYKKLQVNSRGEVIQKAIKNKLV
ncbi:MAG: response regulator transcription factor [Ignavibacteriales bacterium]|nr:response regulator transcription factor [Ignavibacteriales bacterium]